jgi:hypothetical protein
MGCDRARSPVLWILGQSAGERPIPGYLPPRNSISADAVCAVSRVHPACDIPCGPHYRVDDGGNSEHSILRRPELDAEDYSRADGAVHEIVRERERLRVLALRKKEAATSLVQQHWQCSNTNSAATPAVQQHQQWYQQ